MSLIFHRRVKDRRRWQGLRLEILKSQGYRCNVCGRILHQYNFVADHIKPLFRMAEHEDVYDKDNIQCLCYRCNLDKTARENRERRPKTKDEKIWEAMVNELLD